MRLANDQIKLGKLITKFDRTLSTKSEEGQAVRNRLAKIVMERLKSIRSYLSSPPSPPSPSPPSDSPPHSPSGTTTPTSPVSPTSPIFSSSDPLGNEKSEAGNNNSINNNNNNNNNSSSAEPRRFNLRLQKSFNESTRLITSLLQFRPSKTPSPPESTPPIHERPGSTVVHNNHNRGRFFRSKSIMQESKKNKAKEDDDGHESEPDEHHRNLSKKQVLSEERVSIDFIVKILNQSLDTLIGYFSNESNPLAASNSNFLETSDVSSRVYYQLALHAKHVLTRCSILAAQVDSNASKYDYNGIKINGYRSLLRMYELCLRRLLVVVNELKDKKSHLLLLKLVSTNLRDFQSWLRLLEKFEVILQMCVDMQAMTSGNFDDDDGERSLTTTASTNPSTLPWSNWSSQKNAGFLFVHSTQIINTKVETDLFQLASQIEVFFGKVCGFQYCDSLQLPLTWCAIALASYNDGFEMFPTTIAASNLTSNGSPRASSPSSLGSGTASSTSSLSKANTVTVANNPNSSTTTTASSVSSATPSMSLAPSGVSGSSGSSNSQNQSVGISTTIGKAAMSFMSSTKYIMDPDLRAKKMSHVMRMANVEFCKEFWQLTETSIVQLGSNLVSPRTAVNVVKALGLAKTLKVPKANQTPKNPDDKETGFVEVRPPKNSGANDAVNIRIISHELRKGMQELDHLKTVDYVVSTQSFNQSNLAGHKSSAQEPSRCLMLHAHGGGFIAQSSKSHEIYLRPWARELCIPIVSIDYSLAPENPFPKASEECFYVYCWCLLNKEALGWTGEKIICVGDSAGGVLVTNIVQRAIIAGIRIPDALVPIYSPFLVTFSLSPSRLLSIMDPLLNFGVLWRCLAAYCGINFQTETENYRNMLDLNQNASNSPITPVSKKSSFRFSYKSSQPNSADSVSPVEERPSTTTANGSLSNEVKSKPVFKCAPSTEDSSTSLNSLSDPECDRIKKLHRVMGDAIFLVEKLRTHELPNDPFISPLLSEDWVLAKFPRTCIITTSLDPLLDDSIEFKKTLKRLNVANHNLVVFNNLNHGFLNFTSVSKDCRRASKLVTGYIIKCILDDSPINEQLANLR